MASVQVDPLVPDFAYIMPKSLSAKALTKVCGFIHKLSI